MPERKLLLVGWDGADWELADPLMESGQLPQLRRLVETGAHGPLASVPPYLSPMLWNSMATGMRPHRHGILGFAGVSANGERVRPATSRDRKGPAFWNMLSAKGMPNHVVSWFASHPAEKIDGVCVSETFTRPPRRMDTEWPVPRHSVAPESWAGRLGEVRARMEDLDPNLLELLVPDFRSLPRERDKRWEKILYRLAELYTVHNVAATLLESGDDWRCLAVYYHFIDWVCHDFMAARAEREAKGQSYAASRYGGVVDGAYRIQDFLLTDLMRLAGPETTVMVVSDHGFQSGAGGMPRIPEVPAGIASWHRPQGVLAISGPGIRPDFRVEGATILDVAPTVLHLLGLPVGADMDGRALHEVESSPSRPQEIPTWSTETGTWWQPVQEEDSTDVEEEESLLRQFMDLGYVEARNQKDGAFIANTRRDWNFNLGISLIEAGEHEQALEPLWEAYAHGPEMPHYAFHFARALALLGLGKEAEEVSDILRDYGEENTESLTFRARLAGMCGNLEEVSDLLLRLEPQGARHLYQRAALALRRKSYEEAERLFRQAVEAESQSAVSWAGLARALFHREAYEEAGEAARRAASLRRDLALPHFTLAQLAEVRGDTEEAARRHAQALSLLPGLRDSREALVRDIGEVSLETRDVVLDQLSRARQSTFSRPDPARIRERLEGLKRRFFEEREAARANATPVEIHTFPAPVRPGQSGRVFHIVSGIPRSGTSLVMQMLAAGGMEPMSDAKREADEDNPKGYFEWEAAKRLADEPELIEQAGDRPVKVVSPLLPMLPRQHRYRVLYIQRRLEEVARSQAAMLQRSGKIGGGKEGAELEEALRRHEAVVRRQLRERKEFEILDLSYSALIENPEKEVERIREFFGKDLLPHAEAMQARVDPTLYRQRAG